MSLAVAIVTYPSCLEAF